MEFVTGTTVPDQNKTIVVRRVKILGAGHQAVGTSSRIVKLGTSSQIVP